jgi:hypothetical protein
MATVEDALVPLYLHHRYAVEAAASAIGGQDYTYALRGDGHTPVSWVPAARQKAALDALLVTIKPSELTIAKAILDAIPPRPSGVEGSRELFPRTTGGAFDPIMPATVAADMTIGFILTPPRASRLVAEKAVDSTLPGLDDVIERLIAAAFNATPASAYEAEVSRSTQRVLTSYLMRLAASAPSSQVRAVAAFELHKIAGKLVRTPTMPVAEQAHRQLLAGDIDRFFTGPGDPVTRIIQVPGLPPGAPIGEPAFSVLLGEMDCSWVARSRY